MDAMASQITSLTINCLLNRLFMRRSKEASKLRVTGLCVGNSPVTGEFPAQMVSNAENVSVWWRHRVQRGVHHELFFYIINPIYLTDSNPVIYAKEASKFFLAMYWIDKGNGPCVRHIVNNICTRVANCFYAHQRVILCLFPSCKANDEESNDPHTLTPSLARPDSILQMAS